MSGSTPAHSRQSVLEIEPDCHPQQSPEVAAPKQSSTTQERPLVVLWTMVPSFPSSVKWSLDRMHSGSPEGAQHCSEGSAEGSQCPALPLSLVLALVRLHETHRTGTPQVTTEWYTPISHGSWNTEDRRTERRYEPEERVACCRTQTSEWGLALHSCLLLPTQDSFHQHSVGGGRLMKTQPSLRSYKRLMVPAERTRYFLQ